MVAALGLGLAAYVAIFLYAAIRGLVVTPYADPHDWDVAVFLAEKSGRWLTYFWEPHTNQRIVFARALTLLDVDALGRMHVPVFLLGTVGALFLSAGVLVAILWRGVRSRNLATALSGLASMLLLSVAACEDCAFPVFSVYIFVSAFAAMALAAVELAEAGAGRGFFLAALAFAVLAGFGNAAGLAVWPVLIYTLARNGQPRWRLLATVGVGAAYIAASMSGLGAPSQHLDKMSLTAPAHLLKMLVYFTGYCGLPWSGGGEPKLLAHAMGLAFASLGAWLVLRGQRSPGAMGRLERIGCNLILFALLTAVLATFGRVDENEQPVVPTRYFPFASLLQVGLVFALVAPLQRLWERSSKVSGAAVALVACLLLNQQLIGARRLVRTAENVRAASVAFDSGERSAGVTALVYPDASRAAGVRAELKRRGLPF